MTEPAVMTAEEVAKLARVSVWTVCEWTRTGVLPRLPGRRVRIPTKAVHELLEGRYDASREPVRETQAQTKPSRRRLGFQKDGPLASSALGERHSLLRPVGPSSGDVVVRRVER